MPDLRGHGSSGKPHDPAACPPDVLTDDGLAIIEQRIFAGWGTFAQGSPEAQSEHWMRQSDADPVALEHVLDSVVATRAEEVSRIEVPVLVVLGTDDERARSSGDLVAALPHGTLAVVPGDHGTAPAAPEFAAAIADFLARR